MSVFEIVRPLCPNLFAIVDGALAKGFPDGCGSAGLSARSLYSGEFAPLGPHLVSLPDESAIDSLEGILPEGVHAVFWVWTEGEAALYQHLRRLGKVEVPSGRENDAEGGFQTVIFRHADPVSLNQTLPVLDAAQREMFFASSPGLVFEYRDRRGRHEIVRARQDGRLLRELSSGNAIAARASPRSS